MGARDPELCFLGCTHAPPSKQESALMRDAQASCNIPECDDDPAIVLVNDLAASSTARIEVVE